MTQAEKAFAKEIKEIKKTLKGSPRGILDLRAEKVRKYLEYRLGQLVRRRIVLLPDETKYLLAETGPSPLRFDPAALDLLLDKEAIASPSHYSQRQIDGIHKIKEQANEIITTGLNKEELRGLIKKHLESKLGDLEVISSKPLVFKGMLDGRSVVVFVYNNEWILPDNRLIKDLKLAYELNSHPVFLAKKIHGMIFPYFKAIGAQGFNMYSALLMQEDIAAYNRINSQLKIYQDAVYMKTNPLYQARVQAVDMLADNDAPLSVFLDNVALQVTLSDFLTGFRMSKHSFAGQVDSLSSAKVRKLLAGSVAKRSLFLDRIGHDNNE
jgi:hypothetical protein